MNNNIDYDTFVRNPPNTVDFSDIFNDPLSDTLLSFSSSPSSIPNSFNISSFNVNGLKTPGQGSFKMDQISSFFSYNHISFGGIVDTHLSPKQMKFLSKRVAAKRIHRLFHYLLSHNYEDCTPFNLSGTLASIFDAHDLHISDHNPIITYFDASLLSDAIKSARAAFADDLDKLCPIDSLVFTLGLLIRKAQRLGKFMPVL
ncbi:hypothetical protein RhiirC2_784597 [Rhizophagus irregularis]|uniref:Uncharacterized protein n=1 Tax=Rhizophagus irregularis TaxID=588596 RepID=A0A2N1MY44_9GLOM|nr:hypothetical protein RhiirC2_784597 [Rhizophagus irregularis]